MKIFCYHKISKYSSKQRRNFYPAVINTQVISVLYLLPLFCFGQFVFNVMWSCTVSVFALHCYRGASLVVTERRAMEAALYTHITFIVVLHIHVLDNSLTIIEMCPTPFVVCRRFRRLRSPEISEIIL